MEYPPNVREKLLVERVRNDGMIARGLYEELEEIYSLILKQKREEMDKELQDRFEKKITELEKGRLEEIVR